MRWPRHLLLASTIAANLAVLPVFAATPALHSLHIDPAALALVAVKVARPQISINLQALEVAVDSEAISRLSKDKPVLVSIAGVGQFEYIIDYVNQDAEVLAIGGHIVGNPAQKITLGLRSDGVSGLIETPNLTYALGYADRVQMAGVASSQWMSQALATEKTAMHLRQPAKGEHLPAPGAEPISLDFGVLTGMQQGEDVIMQLAGMGATRVSFEEIRPGDGSATWIGHLKDFGDNYKVLLTYSPDATEGFILTPKGEINLMSNASGELYQFNPGAAGYKNMTGDGESCAAIPATAGMQMFSAAAAATATTGTPSAITATTAKAAATATQTVDLLVLYSPGMLSVYGSADKVATRVDALIAAANQAYVAGGLAYQVRRVGLEMVSVDDKTSNDSLLNQMKARTGAFATMGSRRDQLGADLVTVIRPLYAQVQGSCGVGYVSGYGGSNVSQYADYGLSVLGDGNDRTGQNYYCDPLTMTHELGHNMGLMHDRSTVAQQGGGVGVTPYAFGFAVAGRWGTIMSYTSPRQIKFSNPDDYTCGTKERCGVPESSPTSANNVKALAQSMPLVAGFRPSAGAAQTYSVTGVVTLNGTPTAGVAITASGVTASSGTANASLVACQSSGSTGVFSCSAPAGYSFTLSPSYPSAPAGTAITWTPASATISAIAANKTSNFSGTSKTTVVSYSVGGAVSIDGKVASGVSFKVAVPAGSDASKVSCTNSTSTGQYSCKAPAGYSFTLTPVYSGAPVGSTLTWAPANVTVSKLSANQVQNFTGKLTVPQVATATTYVLSISISVNGQKTFSIPFSVQLAAANDPSKFSCVAAANTTIECRMPKSYSPKVAMPTSVTMNGKRVTFVPTSMAVNSIAANTSFAFVGTAK